MQSGGSTAFIVIYVIVALAVAVFMLAAMWQPGWAIFIPIYNTIVLLRVAGKPWWWLFLFLIPIVDFVVAIMVYAGVASNYGKSAGFTLGLIFLPYIFVPILGFGGAVYQGRTAH